MYSRAALTSRALSEYPELKQEWEEAYKDLEPRILTMVYQRFYVMECLMYSDEDLRRYYDANKSLFAEDSVSDYYALRKKIAESYYIFKNQEQWNAYLKEHAAPTDTMALRGRFVETYRQQLRDSVSKQVEEHRLMLFIIFRARIRILLRSCLKKMFLWISSSSSRLLLARMQKRRQIAAMLAL